VVRKEKEYYSAQAREPKKELEKTATMSRMWKPWVVALSRVVKKGTRWEKEKMMGPRKWRK